MYMQIQREGEKTAEDNYQGEKKKAIHFEHVSGFSFVAKKSAPSTTEGTRKRRMTTLQSDTLKKVR